MMGFGRFCPGAEGNMRERDTCFVAVYVNWRGVGDVRGDCRERQRPKSYQASPVVCFGGGESNLPESSGSAKPRTRRKRRSWLQLYSALEKAISEDGVNLRREYVDLYEWVLRQRRQMKTSKLDQEKTDLLQKLNIHSIRRQGPVNHAETKISAGFLKMISEFKRYVEEGGNPKGPFKSKDPLGHWCYEMRSFRERGMLSDTQIRMLEDVGFVWQSQRQYNWNQMLKRLQRFRNKTGHCRLSSRDDPELARWMFQQKYFERTGKMAKKSAEALRAVDPSWMESLRKPAEWDDMFAEFLEIRERLGDSADFTNTHAKLGAWLRTQRHLARQGLLDPEHARLLQENGIQILKKKSREELWEERFLALSEWKERYGTLEVNPSGDSENFALHLWVERQRLFRPQLTEEQEKRLESLGFEWDQEEEWGRMLQQLKNYKEEHGNCDPPPASRLAVWINDQCMYYHSNRLSEHRETQLRELGIEVSSRCLEQQWMKLYAKLDEFYKEHGHSDVPLSTGALGKWAARQRSLYKRGRLSRERIKMLSDLKFTFILRMDTWRSTYMEVLAVGLEKLSESQQYWLNCQRSKRRRNLLPKEKLKLLDTLGVWDPDLEWEDGMKLLVAFKERKGHTHVAIEDEGELAVWLTHRRWMQREGSLSSEEESALAAEGVVFDVLQASFLTKYNLLKEYVHLYGKEMKPCRVPDLPFRFSRLNSFLWAQRDLYRRGKLNEDRKMLLLELEVDLDAKRRGILFEPSSSEESDSSDTTSNSKWLHLDAEDGNTAYKKNFGHNRPEDSGPTADVLSDVEEPYPNIHANVKNPHGAATVVEDWPHKGESNAFADESSTEAADAASSNGTVAYTPAVLLENMRTFDNGSSDDYESYDEGQ